jgi:hypothetical protein
MVNVIIPLLLSVFQSQSPLNQTAMKKNHLLLSNVSKNSVIVISFSSYGSKYCYSNGLFAEIHDNFVQKNVQKLFSLLC